MRPRLQGAILAAVSATVFIGAAQITQPAQAHPSRFIYAWAGTGMSAADGTNMIAVLDADPASPGYGNVVGALTVDSAGRMPHHSEFTAPEKGPMFVNDFGADKSYLIDFTNPAHPRVAGRMDSVPGARRAHSFARLPNGHVLATIQFGDGKSEGDPGALAEFDANGKLARYSSAADAAFPGARLRTYGLTVLPAIDRVVTTSSPMADERTANVVQIWRMSDLRLLKTLAVPVVEGDSVHMYPFELRTLADGRTVMMNTYYCGFYTITDLDREPKITQVMRMDHPRNIGCSVPVINGKFMLMPIAYAHRFATIDISDPSHPREVQSLQMDSTFFPHWIAMDPGSDRVVVTDQGDGPPMLMVGHFDRATAKLSWDQRFRDPGASKPGVSFARATWPNGVKGMAMPHGAVFVR